MSRIAPLRSEIDTVDARLVAALAERRRIVEQLALAKAEGGLAPVDAAREDALAQRWAALAAHEGLPIDVALAVLEAILATSRSHVAATIVTATTAATPRPRE